MTLLINIKGGVIPSNYIPAVEKGIKQRMELGVLAGYPLVDIQIDLHDGKYHDVDSSDMAFQIAGSMAFASAVQQANPCLLEPIMNVTISVPDQYMGSIIGDLNGRRGQVMGVEQVGETADNSGDCPTIRNAPLFHRLEIHDKCTW